MKTLITVLALSTAIAQAELFEIRLEGNSIDLADPIVGGTMDGSKLLAPEEGNPWFSDLSGDGVSDVTLSPATFQDDGAFSLVGITINGTELDSSYDMGVIFNRGFENDGDDVTTAILPVAFGLVGRSDLTAGLLEVTTGGDTVRRISLTRLIWDSEAVISEIPATTPTLYGTTTTSGFTRAPQVTPGLVTTSADSGPGSLRQAVSEATEGDIITFAIDEIILTSASIDIVKTLTLDGGAFPNNVTIQRSFETAERFPLITANFAGTCRFQNLTLTNGDNTDAGGAILSFGTAIEIRSCLIRNNASSGRGAGIYCDGGSLLIEESSIIYNTSTDDGGGIAILNSNITAKNTTISHNTAADLGGGIYGNESATLFLQHCTLYENNAGTTFGGGAYSSLNSANLSVELHNSLFVNNTAMGTYDPITGVGGTLIFSGLVDTEDTTGISSINNPAFVLGGDVPFGAPNLGHRISSEATAIINQADTDFALPEDQRGYPRALADTSPDIGATEYFSDRLTAWKLDNFGPAALSIPTFEATLWGTNADPDNDGQVNHQEFAHRTNPLVPNGSPISVGLETIDGVEYPTLTYEQNSEFGLPGRAKFFLRHLLSDGSWLPVDSVLVRSLSLSPTFSERTIRTEQSVSEFGPSALFRLEIGGD